MDLRACRPDETERILQIVNAAAERYRGIIPEDRWHDPYMSRDELQQELAAGVSFAGAEVDGQLVGVMGTQPVQDVLLIRHAYVLPEHQGSGIGSALLGRLTRDVNRPVLIGTWRDASWAIAFYNRHGFRLVSEDEKAVLLRRYWTIPERQIETSVVLVQ